MDIETAMVKIEKVEINSVRFLVHGQGYGNLFCSDHVAIYAVPYRFVDGHVPYFDHFLCHFRPFFPASGEKHA